MYKNGKISTTQGILRSGTREEWNKHFLGQTLVTENPKEVQVISDGNFFSNKNKDGVAEVAKNGRKKEIPKISSPNKATPQAPGAAAPPAAPPPAGAPQASKKVSFQKPTQSEAAKGEILPAPLKTKDAPRLPPPAAGGAPAPTEKIISYEGPKYWEDYGYLWGPSKYEAAAIKAKQQLSTLKGWSDVKGLTITPELSNGGKLKQQSLETYLSNNMLNDGNYKIKKEDGAYNFYGSKTSAVSVNLIVGDNDKSKMDAFLNSK